MHRRHLLKPLKTRLPGTEARAGCEAGEARDTARNTNLLLLISDDVTLGKSLRDAAERMGLLFAHSSAGSNVLWQLRALRPGAVVIDLDLPSEAVWETANRLLDLESCPLLFGLTGRRDQLDATTAVRSGLIVDKPPGPVRLLRLAEQVSPQSTPGERNSIQRVKVQWFGPCGWPVRVTSANGFCGINE